jgi:hypothetical protein
MKRGLLLEPEQWQWTSYRSYESHQQGRVKINQWPNAVMKVRAAAGWLQCQGSTAATPSICAKPQSLGHYPPRSPAN